MARGEGEESTVRTMQRLFPRRKGTAAPVSSSAWWEIVKEQMTFRPARRFDSLIAG